MSSTIIHFGMHKTGSSSIQRSLYHHLADPNFCYLDLKLADPGGKIALAFGKEPEKAEPIQRRGWRHKDIERRKKRIREMLASELLRARSFGATAILSAEYISVMDADEFGCLCEFVRSNSGRTMAVGYVRSPKSYMESVFQQFVQRGAISLVPADLYPHYRRFLAKFDSELGADHVRFWRFDPLSFPEGCVVRDFCGRLAIDFDAKCVIRANEGLSRWSVSLLLAYRRFGPGFGVGPAAIRENRLLVTRLAQLKGPKLHLHSSLVAPVLDAQRDDIAWMEKRLGQSLAENIADADAQAVRSEQDLLDAAPEALEWLSMQLGPKYEKQCRPGINGRQVAEYMHALRLILASRDAEVQIMSQTAADRE